jgi:undecaprenyl-diphosphatase
VLIWNSQRHWITLTHLGQNASLETAWHPTLKYFAEFLGSEVGLLNPVFFLATCWAGIALWRRFRPNPHLVYFFSMGAPLFLAYTLYSFHSRILPNWIAPSVLPLLCMSVIYWDLQWRLGAKWLLPCLKAGLLLGAAMVGLCHDTNLVRRFTGHYLPVKLDPLHRVREWDKTALAVEDARQTLAAEGKPTFIITAHYGMAGQISFYDPEARAHVKDTPLVYYQTSDVPQNQFYFWPGYTDRKGDNAIYVRELDRDYPFAQPAPELLQREFESVTPLGVTNILYHERFLLRPLELFACRGLR